jgi:hypothetical protein
MGRWRNLSTGNKIALVGVLCTIAGIIIGATAAVAGPELRCFFVSTNVLQQNQIAYKTMALSLLRNPILSAVQRGQAEAETHSRHGAIRISVLRHAYQPWQTVAYPVEWKRLYGQLLGSD